MWFLRPSNRVDIRPYLGEQVHPAWKAAHQDYIEDLAEGFETSPFHLYPSPHTLLGRLTDYLCHQVKSQVDLIAHLRSFHSTFLQRYARAASVSDQHRAILDYARVLGASENDIQEDRRALERFLDRQAMDDRSRRRIGEAERKLVFDLDQLGTLAAQYLAEESTAVEQAWGHLGLEKLCLPLVDHKGDTRVRTAALRTLIPPICALPQERRGTVLSADAVRRIYQIAQQPELDVWLQDQAMQLIRQVNLSVYETLLTARLKQDHGGDDLFFRRRAAGLLAQDVTRVPSFQKLADAVAADPSPFVRQGLSVILESLPKDRVEALLPPLLLDELEPAVRAHAWLGLAGLLKRDELFEFVLETAAKALSHEDHDYVARVGLHVVTALASELSIAQQDQWYEALHPVVCRLHLESSALPVRRWAAQAKERLWCQHDERARHLKEALQSALSGVRPGKRRLFSKSQLPESAQDVSLLGRVLSVMSQEDFGWDVATTITGRLKFTRGHRFGFRWWRFLHEFRNPSPDKRQGFRHTTGRKFTGRLRAPSAILAEISPTKVPGEPLVISEEAGWRPYLPLVDEVVSSLSTASTRRPIQIVTSEGVTLLAPPKSMLRRLWVRLRVTSSFANLAAQRNWKASSGVSADSYVSSLRKLGFDVRFESHDGREEEVVKFFDVTSGMMLAYGVTLLGPESWDRLKEYFYSVYGNSLLELGVFMALIGSLFLGRHYWVNRRFQKARRGIPQVLGGWGTRGKSGTERIKAALINALGYPLVSKTTGCEAMFLHADSYGTTEELFLFRPYDKATIWEQLNIVALAKELKSKVFLWECMGLTPSYVAILQRQWMRDDLSTIVNTYPDHEDLQGPAGVDIPEVMTNFLAKDGKVLTSEQHMTPILKDAAEHRGTQLQEVNWIAPGLLTPDIIDRFPYDEHPNNIALVMAMGEELGVSSDFAVKEMADRVVPDLGVLKTFPEAVIDGRRLVFINGMSANERFGCLANWRRLKFDSQDTYEEPGEWLSTVVNNRADRIARSKVFATILVQDLSVDRHFLIGSNLKGMLGYIREAWNVHVAGMTLSSGDAAIVLEQAARRLRQPLCLADVEKRLRSMLEGLAPGNETIDSTLSLVELPADLEISLLAVEAWAVQKEAIMAHVNADLKALQSLEAFHQLLKDGGEIRDSDFHALLWKWFERKLFVVEDYHASGDTVIQHIATATPPGFRNRVMGLQNIKGTGLDFVYRWQAWDKCYAACERLKGADTGLAEEGLHQLASIEDHGLLGRDHVRATLDEARESDVITCDDTGTNRKEMLAIRAHLDEVGQDVAMTETATSGPKWLGGARQQFVQMVEAFLDAGDAVRRRKRADRIYKDLAGERISIARAAKEIQLLNKRQKGGWFGAPDHS